MHPLSGPPFGPTGCHISFRAGELSGPSEPPAIFEGPPRQNPWAHAPPPQGPHLVLPLRLPHSHRLGLARLLKANPNPRSATERPFPRGLAPQHWILGTPESQCQTHTATRPPPGPKGRRHSFRSGEPAGPSEPQATFESPPCQNSWAHAPPPLCPHLGPPICLPHSHGLQPASLLGPNPNPRLAPKWPFPRGLAPQCWGLRTPEPQCQTHAATRSTPGPIGALPLIQGGRTGRALQAPSDLRRPPMPKPLVPCFPSPALSPRPANPLAPQPWAGPFSLLGAKP